MIELWRQTMRELAVDKGRLVLVTLGVIWGVLSLTVVLAFGTGLDRAIKKTTIDSGVDLLRLSNGTTTRPAQGRPAGTYVRLNVNDAKAIAEGVAGVRGVSVEYISYGTSCEYQGRVSNTGLHGVDPVYGEMRRFPAQAGGRFINRLDILERRRVAFLGHKIKQRLFGAKNPIGETIKLFGTPFTVIGVLQPKRTITNYEGMDELKILIPSTTFKALLAPRGIQYLLVWLANPDRDQRVLDATYTLLSERHQFDPNDRKAIRVFNHVDNKRRIYTIIDSTRILLGLVTLFGFLVSMVGVTNVMYVMVEERSREIGIQMALGARPGHILRGRLWEGLLITLSGSVIGIATSAIVIAALRIVPLDDEARAYLGFPELSIVTALLIASLLGVAGCLAGYWPARRAAQVNPVQILQES